jgi:hypothetical protein
MVADNHRETSWTWDETLGEIELWTTRRSVFLKAVSVNPNYKRVYSDIPSRSYIVTWPISEGRVSAEVAVKNVVRGLPEDEIEEIARRHLTDLERENRTARQERARSKLSSHWFSQEAQS